MYKYNKFIRGSQEEFVTTDFTDYTDRGKIRGQVPIKGEL